MAEAPDPAALAGRIDALLGELRGDARGRAVAEQLVQSIMQFYGAAFERTLDVVAEQASRAIDTLAADPLVSSVMLLHDLHPADRDRRIAHALDCARATVDDPRLTIAVVAPDAARVRIRLGGTHPAALAACRETVLRTVRDALPEIADIDFDDPPPPTVTPLPLCRADGTPVPLTPLFTSPPVGSRGAQDRTGA